MTAIFKREFKSCFTGMIGWVIAAVSLFFLGLYFTNRNLLYASSDFASVLYTMTMILLFLLPAISMRSFAEERKNKTDQLLLTSPVSIPAIVAGKFLAELAVFALPLAAAVVMPLLLQAFGTVSLVAAYSALLGYLLLGGACLAVGTWISALTENQILAYLATFGALLVAYLMNGIQTMFTTGNLLAFIVFMIVLFSILLQGSLLPLVAKKLDMIDEKGDVMKTFNDYSDEVPVQFIQLSIPKSHHWCGKTLKELTLPPETLVVLLKRNGENIIPNGDTRLLENDVLVLSATSPDHVEGVSLVEIYVDENSKYNGKLLSEIPKKENTLVIMIQRGEQVIIPHGNIRLESGDMLVVSKTEI